MSVSALGLPMESRPGKIRVNMNETNVSKFHLYKQRPTAGLLQGAAACLSDDVRNADEFKKRLVKPGLI